MVADAGGVAALLGRIELGDARLQARLVQVVEALAEQPEASLPQACGTWAATLGAYRLFGNQRVTPEGIWAGIAQATVARCREGVADGDGTGTGTGTLGDRPLVLAVQDTTSLDYTGHRRTVGLGPLEDPAHRGLFLHSTLAVRPTGEPLGLLDQQVWARDPAAVGQTRQRKARPIEAKESAKWLRALWHTEALLGPDVRVLTVADREADVYEVFALAHTLAGEWLIRARHDRVLAGDAGHLRAAVAAAPVVARATLDLPRHDARPARAATVEVRQATVVLVPPRPSYPAAQAAWWRAHPGVARLVPEARRPVRVGVVLVVEPAPPVGAAPVHWLLLTSLPLDTPAALAACIAYYRLRWLIERFHFVLKSGCRVERLQLTTATALARALAAYAAVAWWLLWLTHAARLRPEAPCTLVFDSATWQALYATHHQTLRLPATPPDLGTAVHWIAQLGGYLGRRGDGEPGVQTLWRGLQRLRERAETWRLLTARPPPAPHPPTSV